MDFAAIFGLVACAILLFLFFEELIFVLTPKDTAAKTDVLARISTRNLVHIGIGPRRAPFASTAPDGSLKGLHADLARLISEALDVELNLEILDDYEAYEQIKEMQIDILISGSEWNAKQAREIGFYGPYLTLNPSETPSEDGTPVQTKQTRMHISLPYGQHSLIHWLEGFFAQMQASGELEKLYGRYFEPSQIA
jgi:ABC-type amino acid transport substrate-binding protein